MHSIEKLLLLAVIAITIFGFVSVHALARWFNVDFAIVLSAVSRSAGVLSVYAGVWWLTRLPISIFAALLPAGLFPCWFSVIQAKSAAGAEWSSPWLLAGAELALVALALYLIFADKD